MAEELPRDGIGEWPEANEDLKRMLRASLIRKRATSPAAQKGRDASE